MRVLSEGVRAAKLAKLCEIEGFEDENELFAAAMADSVCPAICCNPDNPECDYTEEKEPDSRQKWLVRGLRARDARVRARFGWNYMSCAHRGHHLNHGFAEHR